MQYCQNFGERMRESRQKAGKSQRQIADAAGISPQMVSAYEKGARAPSIEVAAQLAGELGVSLDYLCGIDLPDVSQHTFKNYADLISYISELSRYLDCKSSIQIRPRNEEDYEYVSTGFPDSPYFESYPITEDQVAVIEIQNGIIVDFFRRWEEIQTLHQKGIISDELLDSWYLGEMERLQKWIIGEPKDIHWFGIEPARREEESDGHH